MSTPNDGTLTLARIREEGVLPNGFENGSGSPPVGVAVAGLVIPGEST
jgi:hypothetical protein